MNTPKETVRANIFDTETTESFRPSLSLIFLCLFTISNYFSPIYFLGPSFARLPFVLAVLVAVTYLVRRLVRMEALLRFNAASITLLLVFLFAVNASYYATIDPVNSQTVLSDFSRAVVLFFLIGHVIDSPRALKFYLLVLVFCSFGLAFRYVHFPIWEQGRASLAGSTLTNNPNGLSAVFVYSLPIAVGLILSFKNKLLKLFLCYAIFVLFLGIIEGQSRGGFLALAVSGAMLLYEVKSRRYRLYIIMVLIVAAPMMFLRYAPPKYIDRIMTIFVPAKEYTGSAEARASSMSIAFKYTIGHPFSEYGLGNHSSHIADVYGEDLTSATEYRGGYLVHNIFLQYGADVGLIPLTFFLIFTFVLFRYLAQSEKNLKVRSDPVSREMVVFVKALKISYCGFIAGAFFLPWAYDFFLYYLGGLIFSIKIISTRSRETR